MNTGASETDTNAHRYFVDEAGDFTLFDRRGKILVGTPGCSKYVMLGVAHLSEPETAGQALKELRESQLADPYFKKVPSMQADARKTAVCFHAKDDLPEVRREVFRLLPRLSVKVQVVVRRKLELVSFASLLHAAGKRLAANDIYDDMAKRLFRNLLHTADQNQIVFARRGKSDRNAALAGALSKAQANFERKWGKPSRKPTAIKSLHPWDSPGLQVIDYYLWALQRLYERGEDRFFELLRGDFRLIMDIDDKRNKGYGEWYSDSNPLSLDKIKAF